MSVGLLFGHDDAVARGLLGPRNQLFFKYDRAVGLVEHGKIIGTIIFHSWNGANVEIGYYGKGTMTAGIIRCIASYTLEEFDPSRLTAVTSKRNRRFIKSLQKLGFRVEGASRCYYGKADTIRNTGVRLVGFREQIEKVARWQKDTKHAHVATP